MRVLRPAVCQTTAQHRATPPNPLGIPVVCLPNDGSLPADFPQSARESGAPQTQAPWQHRKSACFPKPPKMQWCSQLVVFRLVAYEEKTRLPEQGKVLFDQLPLELPHSRAFEIVRLLSVEIKVNQLI